MKEKTMNLIRTLLIIAMVTALAAFYGCAVTPEPLEYQPDNEYKKGPGLLSGKDGVFTIYRQPIKPEADKAPR
jgi:hypothetical protein